MIWKPVTGYQDIYEVSDAGRVRSLRRIDARGWRRKSVLLRPVTHKSGLRYVIFCKHGKMRTHKIHRLMLEAFVSPCPEGMECRHLNGNPADNRLENLCWGTHKENMQDKHRHGTQPYGEKCFNAKLTKSVVKSLRSRKLAWGEQTRLAKKYGVTPSTINYIVHGKTWRNV